MTKKTLALFLILILLRTIAEPGNGGYPGAFDRIGVGARALSLGDAYSALAVDGYAPYYNPAALPFLKERMVALSYSFMSLDRVMNYLGYVQKVEPAGGIAISWLHAGVNKIEGRDFIGQKTGTFTVGEDIIAISLGIRLYKSLAVGLSLKMLRMNLPDLKGSGLGYDLAITLQPGKPFSFALILKDITSSYNYNTQKLFEHGETYIERFPQIMRISFGYRPQENLALVMDLEGSDKGENSIHIGGEYLYLGKLALRAGMNDTQFSGGAGLRYKFIGESFTSLDYTFSGDLAGEGISHIFSWNFSF